MSRLRQWLFASMAAFALAGMLAFLYGWYAPKSPEVRNLRDEDYAVYSALIDQLFGSKRPFNIPKLSPDQVVNVANQTAEFRSPGSILPLELAALGPEEMGWDFLRQSSRPCDLEQCFRSSRKAELVISGDLRNAVSAGMDGHGSCVLQLSRVGFSHRHKSALLYYSYRCGLTCCQSGLVRVDRSNQGWTIAEFGADAIY